MSKLSQKLLKETNSINVLILNRKKNVDSESMLKGLPSVNGVTAKQEVMKQLLQL